MAKLSISIPDDLKAQLDERAGAEHVAVSQVVSNALRSYFEKPAAPPPAPPKPPEPIPPPPPVAHDSAEVRQMQQYLWELYWNHERTRASVVGLFQWANSCGVMITYPPPEVMGMPPWPRSKSVVPKPFPPGKKTAPKTSRAGKKK